MTDLAISTDPASGAGLDLTHPDFTPQLLEALDQGAEIEPYLAGRAGRVSHADLLRAQALEVDLAHYTRARQVGATHDDILAVIAADPRGLQLYATLRSADLPHSEALEAYAHHAQASMVDYVKLRRAGIAHGQSLHAALAQVMPEPYVAALAQGIEHGDILVANAAGMDLSIYTHARELGVTHDLAWIVDSDYGHSVFTYFTEAVAVGADPNEAHEVLRMGISMLEYNRALCAGATHAGVLEAYNRFYSLDEYVYERQYGRTHSQAMAQITEDLKPDQTPF
jgi:hypothetical protein